MHREQALISIIFYSSFNGQLVINIVLIIPENKPLANACYFSSVKVLTRYNGNVFVDKVCDYFGVKIAMYFAYLGHYTAALMWPAFLGTMLWLLSGTHQVNCCLVNN